MERIARSYFITHKLLLKMSEQNSLKLLYATAQTTDDLDLFLYTGLNIVGRDGLVQIVADVIFDRLAQTCEGQKDLALEMLEPSVLMQRIRQMKADFVKYVLGCLGQSKSEWDCLGRGEWALEVTYLSEIWRNYFYEDGAFVLTSTGSFVDRLFCFDNIHFVDLFDIYKFGQDDVNSFVFSSKENLLFTEHTLDFISSN